MFDTEKYPNTATGYEYACKVVSGDIIVCKYVILACQRFIDDLEKAKCELNSFYFDADFSEKYLKLVQQFKHVKGRWKNPFIIYEPWQKWVFANLRGFKLRENNSPRFRTGHIEIPRGNAKSTMASQACLFDLSLNRPLGNEIYSTATAKEQARIVLDAGRSMAKKNQSFLRFTGTRVLKNEVIHEKSDSFFKALSSDSKNLDGLQPALAIIDELHAHKTREVFDVVDSAMSKRSDSLLLIISTAGFDNGGIGSSQNAYARKVLEGEFEDDTFFSVIYTVDKGDDIFSEATWKKANPGYGVSVDPINFRAKATKAKVAPDSLSNFKVKHLNIWVQSLDPFFNIDKWDSQADENLKLEDFRGESCHGAIDLASKIDLTGKTYIFKRKHKEDDRWHYYIFTEAYLPEERLNDTKNDSYVKWAETGDLILTQGEAINYPKLQDLLLEKSRQHKFYGVMYDPWNATEFAQRMTKERIEMVEYRMTTANLSEPMKKIQALIEEGRVHHNGNKVLRWCMGNVVAKRDANDNVFPRKENDHLKIDLAVSTIMAMGGFINDEQKESVYETREMLIL